MRCAFFRLIALTIMLFTSLNVQAQTTFSAENARMFAEKRAQLDAGEETLFLSHEDYPVSLPFASNLFDGGFEAERVDGINDDYIIAPGDKLNIWTWGAFETAEVFTVDNQGNIFFPSVGPIAVGDRTAGTLNQFVSEQIKAVYKNGVHVYVNLLSATPISVYVTGNVKRPGQYAGMPSDSVLYFLKRAGGIDDLRGSYRKISHLRENKLLSNYDLYQFIIKGHLAKSHFEDGDVLLVTTNGPQISVAGDVKYPFSFELISESLSGAELMAFAQPEISVSHVAHSGDRNGLPFSRYIPLHQFKTSTLYEGDSVLFKKDVRASVIGIEVSGSYKGPSFFNVKKGTRLREVLSLIEVDPSVSDFKSVYLYRKSVATAQKDSLDESLNRLQRSVFTAPASSDGEATIRAKEAELVLQFVESAKEIEPKGRVVVSDGYNVSNPILEPGDKIVIPSKTDLISIVGEVLIPQAVVFREGANIEDYIRWAGGFSERANRTAIMILHANGSMDLSDSRSFLNDGEFLKPGDQILVLPMVDAKNMQLVKDITEVLYRIAISANVVARI